MGVNLSSIILDQYDMIEAGSLSTEDMEKLAQQYGDDVHDKVDINRHRDDDFALVMVGRPGHMLRKFPVNSKTNTQLSKHAFLQNGSKLPERVRKIAAQSLLRACKRYRVVVPEEMEKIAGDGEYVGPYYLMTRTEELDVERALLEKAASTEHYAITHNLNGDSMQRYPIDTEDELRSAIREFEKRADQMAFGYTQQMASNIEKRATELGVDIPNDHRISKTLSESFSPVFQREMEKRAELCSDPESAETYRGFIKQASESTPQAVAAAVERMDRLNQLNFRWNRNILPPIDAVMAQKEAQDVISLNDVQITAEDLRKVVTDHSKSVEGYIGQKAMKNLKKDPVGTFKKLPAAQKQALLNMTRGIV